jgi:hypothetical protein
LTMDQVREIAIKTLDKEYTNDWGDHWRSSYGYVSEPLAEKMIKIAKTTSETEIYLTSDDELRIMTWFCN